MDNIFTFITSNYTLYSPAACESTWPQLDRRQNNGCCEILGWLDIIFLRQVEANKVIISVFDSTAEDLESSGGK
jgi:hypothetical protein